MACYVRHLDAGFQSVLATIRQPRRKYFNAVHWQAERSVSRPRNRLDSISIGTGTIQKNSPPDSFQDIIHHSHVP